MAQRGRPKKLEKQIEAAQRLMQNLYAEKRKEHAEKATANLTEEQEKAIKQTNEALTDFVQEFSEMFDVSVDTARKLQTSFWAMRHAFGADE